MFQFPEQNPVGPPCTVCTRPGTFKSVNLATSNPEDGITLCPPSPPPRSRQLGNCCLRPSSVRSAWLFYLRAEQIKKNYFSLSLPPSSLASCLSSYIENRAFHNKSTKIALKTTSFSRLLNIDCYDFNLSQTNA